jgi:NAD(P)-dependent dehydrogenase (short-subunit alcohol dehydrogenase family)
MPGALIIGAGPGIGASVARRVAREGLPVGIIARSQETIDAVLAQLGDVDALGVAADVTDELGLRAALDEIVNRAGVPNLLVYNAAVIRHDRLGELSAREQLDTWAVNVVGAITAAVHLAEPMIRAGGGTIVITGGMPEPVADLTSLSLGKAGVRTLTQLLNATYGPRGLRAATVTVTGAVVPGTALDPDTIADHYWRLHTAPADGFQREVVL